MHHSVVAAGPDGSLFVRRFGDVAQRAVVFGSDGFDRVRTAAFALLLILIASQIGRDFFPRLPAVARSPQQVLGSVVVRVGFVLRPDDRRVPVEQILHVSGGFAEVLNRRGHDVGAASRFRIEHFNRAEVTAAHDVSRVVGIEREERTFAPGRWFPATCGGPAVVNKLFFDFLALSSYQTIEPLTRSSIYSSGVNE